MRDWIYITEEPLAGWPIQDCILVWACTDNVLTIPGTQKRFGETPAETRGVELTDKNVIVLNKIIQSIYVPLNSINLKWKEWICCISKHILNIEECRVSTWRQSYSLLNC